MFFSDSNVNIIYLNAEFDSLYHPDLRQDVFTKDVFHYLNVPRVGTYTVSDIFHCSYECLSNLSCRSFNMAASKRADGKFWCELLSSEKYSNPKEYKGNESSHHYSIKVGLKVAGDTRNMNIFIRQNFVRGAAFKNIISWPFESRLLCNLTEISANNGSA